MAYTTDKKATELDVLTTLANDDVVVIGDTSDNGRAKGITKANFQTAVGGTGITTYAKGDILYASAVNTLSKRAIGSTGQKLAVKADGTPDWVDDTSTQFASETQAGQVEIATPDQVIDRTATDTSGALLAITTQNAPSVKIFDAVAVSSSGTDTYAITVVPAFTAYSTGMQFTFIPDTVNTGACTLNVNGLGAKSIKKNVNQDLATGNILASQAVTVVYDGTNFQISQGSSLLSVNKYTINTFEDVGDWFTTTLLLDSVLYGWVMNTTTAIVTKTIRGDGVLVNVATTGPTSASYSGATTINTLTEARIKFAFKQTSADGREEVRLGFGNNYITISSGSTNVKAESTSGGTTTTTLSGIVSTDMNVFEIIYTTTNVYFYANGILLATHTTNIGSSITSLIWSIALAYTSGSGGATEYSFSPLVLSSKLR